MRHAYLMGGSGLPAVFESRPEETVELANRFAGGIPRRACPQLSGRGVTASVMTLTAVGSSRPSRSNRRHVQKSRASRTSAQVCSAGRPSAGSAVASWRASWSSRAGGALQELVEGGDPARVALDPLKEARRERR
jgi:hypothetical protein